MRSVIIAHAFLSLKFPKRLYTLNPNKVFSLHLSWLKMKKSFYRATVYGRYNVPVLDFTGCCAVFHWTTQWLLLYWEIQWQNLPSQVSKWKSYSVRIYCKLRKLVNYILLKLLIDFMFIYFWLMNRPYGSCIQLYMYWFYLIR